MTIELRDYQSEGVKKVYGQWSLPDVTNTLLVYPTGAGKTIVKAQFAYDCLIKNEPCMVFAHRDVLLGQISLSLCLMNVPHTFIASSKSIKMITDLHLKKYGRSFYDKESSIILTSVDTFAIRVKKGLVNALQGVIKYWLLDEAHHVLDENKWGRCMNHLTGAKGLGVTATPRRSDGKGLGSHSDGVFDSIIVGTGMGELIEHGYLSAYKIFVPPTKLDTTGLRVTASGDLNQKELVKRSDNADITGDAVKHYQRLASGKQAITFTVNIAHSDHVAAQFNAAGIPSLSLSSKTPYAELKQGLADFEAGRILNLVNCDLFGEGFDVAAVACVIMLRKTESYSLFKQQFGRMLRLCEGKVYGILIDHVGNVKRHCIYGAPHDDPVWTLDAVKRSNGDDTKAEGRVCPECFAFYIPTTTHKYICAECNHEETKKETAKQTKDFQCEEGELVEMNVDFINTLIQQRNKVDQDPDNLRHRMQNASHVVRNSAVNNHIKRQHAQNILRNHIQQWCHLIATHNILTIQAVHREFELTFDVNILEAQVLSERLALELSNKIKGEING